MGACCPAGSLEGKGEPEVKHDELPTVCGGAPALRLNSSGAKSSSRPAEQVPVKKPNDSRHSEALTVDRKNFVTRGKVGGSALTDKYVLDKEQMGEGSYGSVCKGTHRFTQAVRAVKTMKKVRLKDTQQFHGEIEIMTKLDHPNIVRLYETFEDAKSIYLVMELCVGGELFDRISDQGAFTEKDCAVIMKQILAGVFYCHKMTICHRDLKPENFLFLSSAKDSPLKIIDFGLAKHFEADKLMLTKVGTPYYVAPQVLHGGYDEKCDIWSCGVIMYILLCGYPPFYGDTDHQILSSVKSGKYNFPDEDWANVSNEAKGIINKLLVLDPKKRLSAEDALNNSWVQEKAPTATGTPMKAETVSRFNAFQTTNRMKKIAMTMIAQNLPDNEIEELKKTFQMLDLNSDGTLTVTEIRKGMEKQGLEIPENLEELMKAVDSDGSGVIDYTEWITATMDRRHFIKEKVCWQAFRAFDLDCDGVITRQELRSVLVGDGAQEIENLFGPGVIEATLADADTNGDGVIDFDEFMMMVGGAANEPQLQSCHEKGHLPADC
eukprot:TRINITY_DN7946_c0_g1_i1.p1 TRINITY_DN7946_c0_g1~~TRINITY_DN7946_c0_g1_i1.p1  ORF type:complete len:549 (+),score=160.44 TRINITY_DN7946_c0_g1_i1:99-1745(+)